MPCKLSDKCNLLLSFGEISEFVGMVRKIFIYTREEVQKMKPGNLNLKAEQNLPFEEGMDVEEVKSRTLASATGPETT